ncbi:MAG TPA: hypothetical protein VII75_03820 [Thermoanaerobaculia bacterium]|nr:hypothetical protein [Thermoanaerobaculia bacterium]
MTSVPSELNAASVIELIDSGAYPRGVVVTIARGFLPLPQEELVAVLSYLGGSEDEEIANAARASIADLPPNVVTAFTSSESGNPEHLARLMSWSNDPVVLEALIRNRAVPDSAVLALALRAEPAVQDVIVINQARILRAPGILDALLANPRATPDVRRRVGETREEFFDKKARIARIELPPGLPLEPDIGDEVPDEIVELLVKAEDPEFQSSVTPALPPSEPDEKKKAIWVQIQNMSVAQKVMLAFRGDKMVRMLLVRERNKLVCGAVMRNPRMTENEAETIAGLRNVDEEVLRILSTRRDWMSKYPVILALTRNPKAPIGVVLPLINRLALRDLKFLRDDRGVAEVVRTTAKRIYLARTQKS